MAAKRHGATEREELEATPPAGFVRARNALAARLKLAGRSREASEVARLRRPNVVAWTVNRLARTDPAGTRRLLDAADQLRRASLRDPRSAPEAVASHRSALQHLVDQAARILKDADVRPSPDVLRRVHATLGAAAADRDMHGALREGRLTDELEAGGFDVLAGEPMRHLRIVKSSPAAPHPPRAARDRVSEREERARQQAAERQARAERRAAEKRKAADAKRQRAIERESRRAERLRTQLREVEERLRYARTGGARPAPPGRTR